MTTEIWVTDSFIIEHRTGGHRMFLIQSPKGPATEWFEVMYGFNPASRPYQEEESPCIINEYRNFTPSEVKARLSERYGQKVRGIVIVTREEVEAKLCYTFKLKTEGPSVL